MFIIWSLSLIMLSSRNSDKHRWRRKNCRLNTLYFQLCVLWLVRWVRCGDYHPWNVQLNVYPGILLGTLWTIRCQTLSSLGFFCHGAFVVWKPNRGKGVVTFVDYLPQCQESCYEQIRCTCKQVCRERCKCFKAACCAHPCAYAARQGFLTGKRQLR